MALVKTRMRESWKESIRPLLMLHNIWRRDYFKDHWTLIITQWHANQFSLKRNCKDFDSINFSLFDEDFLAFVCIKIIFSLGLHSHSFCNARAWFWHSKGQLSIRRLCVCRYLMPSLGTKKKQNRICYKLNFYSFSQFVTASVCKKNAKVLKTQTQDSHSVRFFEKTDIFTFWPFFNRYTQYHKVSEYYWLFIKCRISWPI